MRDMRALFEKLEDPDPGQESKRIDRIVESILKNLGRILNTRHGSSPSAPDYGVLDIAAILHNHPASVAEMEESIKACIRRYEPRLRDPEVTWDHEYPDPLTIRFGISAWIQLPDHRENRRFETLLASTGRVHVKRM